MLVIRTYDLEGMGNDPDGHELLAIVSTIHHEGICETFDDRALCFSKPFDGVTASGVRDVDRCSNLDVVAINSILV